MKRRTFLSAALAAATPGAADTMGSIAPAKLSRLGCTTTCFRFWFAATRPANIAAPPRGDIDLTDVPQLFASEFGVRNVEMWSKHFRETGSGYCAKVRAAVERAGAKLTNVQLDEPHNLSERDAAARAKSVEFVKQWMDRARECGASSLRANTGRSEGREFDFDITKEAFALLTEHGRKIGLIILMENHATGALKPEKVVQIVKAIDSPWCRALPDFGNLPPGADESYRQKMLGLFFPLAHMASAKGEWFDADGGHPSFDISACVRTGEKCGFKGIYSAEFWDAQNRNFDSIQTVRRLLTALAAGLPG
jgi:sugar phosphate isomerase/epimerase